MASLSAFLFALAVAFHAAQFRARAQRLDLLLLSLIHI